MDCTYTERGRDELVRRVHSELHRNTACTNINGKPRELVGTFSGDEGIFGELIYAGC